jgi:hypothetical protein
MQLLSQKRNMVFEDTFYPLVIISNFFVFDIKRREGGCASPTFAAILLNETSCSKHLHQYLKTKRGKAEKIDREIVSPTQHTYTPGNLKACLEFVFVPHSNFYPGSEIRDEHPRSLFPKA